MKCFYHNDADGKCAGFLVYNRAYLEPDIEFIEISYEKPFPMNTILPNEQIYIVICKKYGVGGHAQAAGFTCEKLPFKKGYKA